MRTRRLLAGVLGAGLALSACRDAARPGLEEPRTQRVARLLRETPLIDGHNDLPYVIRADRDARGDVAAFRLAERRNSGDTDIPRLRDGRIGAQFWRLSCRRRSHIPQALRSRRSR